MRAECMPGYPLSTSTSTPESSPTAGNPSASRAASAFDAAFSAYVDATSATSGSTAISFHPAPASSDRYSPSFPALPVAMTSRRSAKRRYGSLLADDQLLDALVGEGQHRVQLRPIVWSSFRGRLQLDQASILDHDAVQVGRRLEVLGVIEVQHRRVLDDSAADCGQVLAYRDLAHHSRVLHSLDRHVHSRAQRPAYQALDLMRPAPNATLDRLAGAAIVGRARQHRVLGRDPALAAAPPVGGYSVLNARRDPHARPPHLDQARTLGVHVDAQLDLQRAQLVGLASVRS